MFKRRDRHVETIRRLTADASNLRESEANLVGLVNSLENRRLELEGKLGEAASDRDALAARVAQMQADLVSADAEVTKLSADLDQARADHLSVSRALQRRNADLAKSLQECANLRVAVDALTVRNAELLAADHSPATPAAKGPVKPSEPAAPKMRAASRVVQSPPASRPLSPLVFTPPRGLKKSARFYYAMSGSGRWYAVSVESNRPAIDGSFTSRSSAAAAAARAHPA